VIGKTVLLGLLRSQKDRAVFVMLSHAAILDAVPANAGTATRQTVLGHGLAVTAYGVAQTKAFVWIDIATVAGAHPQLVGDQVANWLKVAHY
jgi:hypothetical protein